LNCFVIMPFDPSFDDVYSMIKLSVESAFADQEIKCFRLDEAKPAGRITDRLLKELESSSICVADLTGNKPNVMWEVGYAMALSKPLLIITQETTSLPFDLKDMQSLQYDRNHLSASLGKALKQSLIDTIGHNNFNHPINSINNDVDRQNQDLLNQVNDLKEMISQLVKVFVPNTSLSGSVKEKSEAELAFFEGAWIDTESNSHLYAKIINGQLLVPYCYNGNSMLKAYYYDWKKMGDFWFARFQWFDVPTSGYSLLKVESENLLTGAWWADDDTIPEIHNFPEEGSGVPKCLERIINYEMPSWAENFFKDALLGKIRTPLF
jgi:nucleoside 2-deoxyribosyltransferase